MTRLRLLIGPAAGRIITLPAHRAAALVAQGSAEFVDTPADDEAPVDAIVVEVADAEPERETTQAKPRRKRKPRRRKKGGAS